MTSRRTHYRTRTGGRRSALSALARLAAPIGLAALVAFATAGSVRAATIAELSVAEMLDRAALVVEGRVTAVDTDAPRPGPRTAYPWTGVTLSVTDTIKGTPASSRLTLYFLGGERHDRRILIPGMTIPAVGDVGVFFIDAPTKALMNPIVGWSQGHFRIVNDGVLSRVTTEDGQLVQGVSGGVTRVAKAISDGSADGVLTGVNRSQALGPAEFKRRLRSLLASGGTR